MADLESSDEEPDAELDVDERRTSRYLAYLQEHMSRTQDHLLGHDPSRPSDPSFFAPNTFWTGEEKDQFFHALAVHSRLRPDLLAAEIGTKTTADVCVFLDMLADAASSPGQSSSSGAKFVPLPRDDFPAACEVSDDWVAYEETQALAVVALEPALRLQGVERAKEAEVAQKRRELRAKRGIARTGNDHDDHDGSRSRDRAGEQARKAQLAQWTAQRRADWDVQDTLGCLTETSMRTIDAILREGEERRSSLSNPSCSTQPSSEADAQGERTSQAEPATTEHPPSPPITPAADPSPEPAQLLTSAALADLPGHDDPLLSPASRRRLQKRLYMRRKRAERTGGAVDDCAARLKPGRKPAGEAAKRHAHASGKTLPYKLRAHFDERHIDAERLRREGLGLFHMAGLGRLMRTYNELHAVPAAVGSQIAGTTVRALHAHVVAFTTRLVRQAIVSREQQAVAKAQTKAWRLAASQVITAPNVKHALELISDKEYDKAAHFGRLLRRLGFDSDDEQEREDDDDDEGDGDGDNDDNDDEPEPRHSRSAGTVPLFRLIHPPFVRLPEQPPEERPLSSYIPWTSLERGADGEEQDEDGEQDVDGNQADDEDGEQQDEEEGKETLRQVLAEEDALDARDRGRDEGLERGLWCTLKPAPDEDEAHDEAPSPSSASKPPPRKRKRPAEPARARKRRNLATCAPHGRVKSAVYVSSDSDGEDGA